MNPMDASLNALLYSSAEPAEQGTSIENMDLSQLRGEMQAMSESAYREFFRRYYKRLWAYLLVVSNGNEKAIEDALQMTFVRVTKHIRVFDTETIFWGWLTRLAKSAYIDCYRKETVFQRLIRRARNDEGDLNPRFFGNQEVDRVGALEEAMVNLGEKERELIRLKYFEGCSCKSIASELGVTTNAVESRLVRARLKLRRFLLEKNNDG